MRNRDEMEQALAERIGANVKAARLAAGLAQEKLAHAAGLAGNTVARVEAGTSWSSATLAALARALGVELDSFFAEGGTRAVTSGERLGAAA